MSDLVERLRSGRTSGSQTWPELCAEAADRIEALERQLAEAVQNEREACAKVADPPLMHRKGKPGLWRRRRAAIATAIRERQQP